MNDLTIISVFIAGFVSFLSPCIIPLVPMYVGFLAGDLDEKGNTNKKRLLINSVAFLFGLMLIYSLLGATATQLGRWLNVNSQIFAKVSGLLIIFFGIFQLDIFRPNFLKQNKNFRFKGSSGKISSSFLLGMAFSFGWSPCMGPILAIVLSLVASSDSMYLGIFYLALYSLGFSIPFLITTFLIEPVMKLVQKNEKSFKIIKILTGIIMIIIGVLIYMNKLSIITAKLS
ncbi:MAG: cytochrome C biogenesis protein [Clostridiales bacterium]|nr:MAG: cytochrome C biogenesis protein [Clostridiales bacterium]